MPESISDKLRSLGLTIGVDKDRQKSNSPTNIYSVEHVIEGSDLDSIYGKTFHTERLFQDKYVHGNVELSLPVDLEMLLKWAKIPAQETNLDASDFIFLDAETSGLSGGTGTYAFMVGLGFYSPEGFDVTQLFMREPDQEAALLAALTRYVSNYKGLVTFNGKTYDIPLLNGRHILNGLSSPFQNKIHIDLLPLSRRIWRNRLDDRSLKNLELQVLSLSRSQEEVPGWMVPDIYFDYLKTGDARPLSGVFYHNLIDIVSLAALFKFTSNILVTPIENPNIESLDLIAIARLHEEVSSFDMAISLYEKALDQGLPTSYYVQTIMRFANIYRLKNEWGMAVNLWERASAFNYLEPILELCKYYEHHQKDYNQALIWAKRATEILADGEEIIKFDMIQLELEKRCARLSKKLQR